MRRLNPSKFPTGRGTVVYDPRVATSLVGAVAGATNGSSIARKTSFLRDKLGEQIFARGIRIADDPLRPRGLASRPFDGEGVAPEAFDLIADGVLQRWFLDSATARELGYSIDDVDNRSFVEVSGRKGLGVKIDDMLDRLIEKAVQGK